MRKFILFLLLHLIASNVIASPVEDVTRRAVEFASLWATLRWEPIYLSKVLPEYWHPQGNESGLPSRVPDFLPTVDPNPGTFLVTEIRAGRVFQGKSPWVLEGKQSVYCVEILYATVASVSERVLLFPEPQTYAAYFVMAIDNKDGKWKFVQSYPYRASFYEIPYFLKAWEKILGRGAVTNIPEVRQRLLAMVKK